MISKPLVLSSIEIDEKNGTIDLISPENQHCVLCISNVKFTKVDDKFTVIKVDAETGEGSATNDGVEVSDFAPEIQTAIRDLFTVLHYNLKTNEKIINKEAFITLLTNEIKKYIEDY